MSISLQGGLSMAKTDWTSLKSVIAYAETLGKGQSVVKYESRPNYNIMHTENEGRHRDFYGDFLVLYRTR